MKLTEALQILNAARSAGGPVGEVSLCCGFTPLHAATFLQAHLQTRFPDRRIQLTTGLYGDLIGNIERTTASAMAAVILEWSDLEPRLGFRQSGGWKPSQIPALMDAFADRLAHFETALTALASRMPVALSLPTLRLPPVFSSIGAKAAGPLLQLQALLAAAAVRLSGAGVRILNTPALDRLSPAASRGDLRSDLVTGFPFTQPHAEILARLLAECLSSHRAPKKGIITDLDDTLWQGLVGEVGADGVSWSLDHHSQLHGLYQQVLAALAEQGVLLAVASKNDPAVAGKALAQRSDLLLDPASLFPLEIHWGPKSESVRRILDTWNVGPNSVIFLDDSPIEIGEVQSAHPELECLLFPKKDHAAALALFDHLRDIFGKDTVTAEDAIRTESLRQGAHFHQEASSTSHQENFLSTLDATLRFALDPPASQTRVLDLINKTNQFNLNGQRYTETDWQQLRAEPGARVLSISYEDKFGALGTIAVLAGLLGHGDFHMRAWVLSCRAFSRRIEHATLRFLFDHYGLDRVVCDFQPTSKNGPLRDFAATLLDGAPAGPFTIRREDFDQRCPRLSQQVSPDNAEVPV